VGLIAGAVEAEGITTVCVSSLEEIMRRVAPPRRLALPFPLGYPLGRPGDRDGQLGVLRRALELALHPGPPPVREAFDPEGGEAT